jgi:hypothetical protein
MSHRVCYTCVHRILKKEDSSHTDTNCWRCHALNWQDESICLGCNGYGDKGGHGCRGWARKCSSYKRIEEL